jgi:hypothetical protein
VQIRFTSVSSVGKSVERFDAVFTVIRSTQDYFGVKKTRVMSGYPGGSKPYSTLTIDVRREIILTKFGSTVSEP